MKNRIVFSLASAFVCFTCVLFSTRLSAQDVSDRNVHKRGGFHEFGPTAHVAFLGGSITEMNGYRPMVCEMLQQRFPGTKFTFTPAGIASTCSVTGAFRLERDVLSKGKVDLLFVEFAVNDGLDGQYGEKIARRGMEGIVRHLRRHSPEADIVMTFFAAEKFIREYHDQKMPEVIAGHLKVAEYYDISSINLAKEVQEQIDEKKLTWQQFGGVHPAPYGNRIAANMITRLFNEEPKIQKDVPSKCPVAALDQFSYMNGRFVSPDSARYVDAWTWSVPDWKSIPGAFRANNFGGQKVLCCEKPNEELTLEFEGKAIGVFVLAGPDAGVLEYQIDDGPVGQAVLFHHHSQGLHYPRTVMFGDELGSGKHLLKLKLSETVPAGSKGTAARIMQFTVN